jgi:hypothetical protein
MANQNDFGVWDEEMIAAMAAPQPDPEPLPEPELPPVPPLAPLVPMFGPTEYVAVLLTIMSVVYSDVEAFYIWSTDMQWTEWAVPDIDEFLARRECVPNFRIPLCVETWSDTRQGREVRGGQWLRYITEGFPRHEVTLVVAQPDPNRPETREQWDEYLALCWELADTVIISPAPMTHEGYRDFAYYISVVM